MEGQLDRERKSKRISWISTATNIVLMLVKGGVGLWAGSDALFADGIHSATDTLASMAVLGAVVVSNRPADEDHPYGHGKAEVIASALVAVILALAGLDVLYSSGRSIFRTHTPSSVHWSLELLALAAAVVSLVLKEALYRYTIRHARKLESQALVALAEDHRSDVWASLAAAIGIGFSLLGIMTNRAMLTYGDPVAGVLVGILIIKMAYSMGYSSIQTLMERNADPELMHSIEGCVRGVDGVQRIDRIRGREHGHYILVDVRISVYGTLTVQEGHDLSREVKKSIMQRHPRVHEVLIHLNPYYEDEGSGPTY